LIARFHVGGEGGAADVSAEGVEGFEAGGFGIGEEEVFVVVFGFEEELDFDAVGGFDGGPVFEGFAADALDLLFDDESGGVRDFGFVVEGDEFGDAA
jgi:hypothetical protein